MKARIRKIVYVSVSLLILGACSSGSSELPEVKGEKGKSGGDATTDPACPVNSGAPIDPYAAVATGATATGTTATGTTATGTTAAGGAQTGQQPGAGGAYLQAPGQQVGGANTAGAGGPGAATAGGGLGSPPATGGVAAPVAQTGGTIPGCPPSGQWAPADPYAGIPQVPGAGPAGPGGGQPGTPGIPAKPQYLGADVGDEKLKKAVTECIKAAPDPGGFFDRKKYEGAAAAEKADPAFGCVAQQLWPAECDWDKIKQHYVDNGFGENQFTLPKDNLIDQCIVCEPEADTAQCLVGGEGGTPPAAKQLFVHFVPKDAKSFASPPVNIPYIAPATGGNGANGDGQ